MVFRLFHDLYHIQIVTGAFVPYEAVVPTVEPGSIVVMPPDTGNMISFIRFRWAPSRSRSCRPRCASFRSCWMCLLHDRGVGWPGTHRLDQAPLSV